MQKGLLQNTILINSFKYRHYVCSLKDLPHFNHTLLQHFRLPCCFIFVCYSWNLSLTNRDSKSNMSGRHAQTMVMFCSIGAFVIIARNDLKGSLKVSSSRSNWPYGTSLKLIEICPFQALGKSWKSNSSTSKLTFFSSTDVNDVINPVFLTSMLPTDNVYFKKCLPKHFMPNRHAN